MANRAFLKPQLWLVSALMHRRWFMAMAFKSMRVPAVVEEDFRENLMPAPLPAKSQSFVTGVYAPWQRAQAERFRREVTCSQVALWPGAHHYVFIDDRLRLRG